MYVASHSVTDIMLVAAMKSSKKSNIISRALGARFPFAFRIGIYMALLGNENSKIHHSPLMTGID